MPNSEGDFKLRGWSAILDDCVDALLGTMVDDGILPGPASKSSVTSMLNLEGEGCSAAGAVLGVRFDGDDVVGITEALMNLSFEVEAFGMLSLVIRRLELMD